MHYRNPWLLTVLLVGCSTFDAAAPGQYVIYRGDTSQLAELSLDQALLAENAGSVLFDGQPLVNASSLSVPPGKHSVAADCGMVWAHGPAVIEHVFKAGTRYRLTCNGHAPIIIEAE